MAPKILAFAGSTREGSLNKKLLKIAVAGARAAGAEVSESDLREYEFPLYDGDLEQRGGIPEGARRFRDALIGHDGILVASPEYNGSFSGVLKNALDWASREAPNDPPLVAFRGKVAAVMSASPGPFGGVRGQIMLRTLLATLQVLVLPDLVVVPAASTAFTDEGRLRDEKRHAQAEALGSRLTTMITKLKA